MMIIFWMALFFYAIALVGVIRLVDSNEEE